MKLVSRPFNHALSASNVSCNVDVYRCWDHGEHPTSSASLFTGVHLQGPRQLRPWLLADQIEEDDTCVAGLGTVEGACISLPPDTDPAWVSDRLQH